MPSRDNQPDAPDTGTTERRTRRDLLEQVLRAVGMAALVVLLLLTVRALFDRPSARAEGTEVREALAQWSSRQSPSDVHVVLDSAPAPDVRDWLAALPGTGTETTWEGAVPAPSGVAVEPVVDPTQPSRVWVSAPRGAHVVVRDAIGVIDSAVARQGGVLFVVPRVEGVIRAIVNETEATAGLRDSVVVRSVLVLGTAGWESKFIAASLEERGWKVDARFALAPSGDVRQGDAAIRVDTAKYAAVVAIDTVASRYGSQILSFVRDGGGLIAVGEGAGLPSLASILPASVEPLGLPGEFADDSTTPRKALALAPLGRLKEGALALERRGEDVTVAAWRVGKGRVAQIGYHDTWRWRMGGLDEDPLRGHRLWWSNLVSGVAFAPRFDRSIAESVEPTPLATLVSTLGTPDERGPALAGFLDDPRLLPFLFALLLASFFVEWLSRRLRGRA